MRRCSRGAFLALALCLAASRTSGQAPCLSALCYGQALVSSLQRARIDDVAADDSAVAQDAATAMLYVAKRQLAGVRAAREILPAFTASPDSLVRLAAR